MRLLLALIIIFALVGWYAWSPDDPRINGFSHPSSITEIRASQKTQTVLQSPKKKDREIASEVTKKAGRNLDQKQYSTWLNTLESKLDQLQKEIEGLDKIPPCEQHKLLKEAVLRHEPSKDCLKANKLYEEMYLGANRAEEQCRELSDVFSQILIMGYYCEEKSALENTAELRKAVTRLKGHYQRELQMHLDYEIDDIPFDSEVLYPLQTGEFRDPTCAVVPIIYLKYRHEVFKMHSKHFGIVDREIDEFCGDGSFQSLYLDYIRYGEDGNPARPNP